MTDLYLIHTVVIASILAGSFVFIKGEEPVD